MYLNLQENIGKCEKTRRKNIGKCKITNDNE